MNNSHNLQLTYLTLNHWISSSPKSQNKRELIGDNGQILSNQNSIDLIFNIIM
jgi:hypothetical protein